MKTYVSKVSKLLRIQPRWSVIDDYVDLARAASEADWLTVDQFLDGPFKRFLELGSNPAHGARSRARMMEFGRSSFLGFRRRQVERGANGAELDARARDMAAAWFASGSARRRLYARGVRRHIEP